MSGQAGGSRVQSKPHRETPKQAVGGTAKTAVKERGVLVKSAGHPIRKTAGIGKPGGKPPARAFPARQARRAAEAGARLTRTQKAAKAARVTARQTTQAANRALRAVIAATKALATAVTAGGGVVIAVVVVICLCGIILASPLGIFFAGSDEATGAISPAQAVAQINGELGEKIYSMQAQTDLAAATARLSAYEQKEKDEQASRIETLVENAIAEGKIDREAKTQWVEMAGSNFELAESTLASIPAREKISKEIADDPANIQATAEATKTAEQLMAEKVAEVVGADFKFRKL